MCKQKMGLWRTITVSYNKNYSVICSVQRGLQLSTTHKEQTIQEKMSVIILERILMYVWKKETTTHWH